MLIRLFLFAFCVFSTAQCSLVQAQEIEIEVALVKIEKGIEKPWANAFVKIYPFFGSSLEARTDQNGKVRFRFQSSRSVVFRVGDDRLLLTTRLGPLSGRMTQQFSFVSDPQAMEYGLLRTMQQTMAYTVDNPNDLDKFAKLGLKHYGIEGILSDLRFQSGGRLMTKQSKEYLRDLRNEVERQFSPPADASQDERQYIGRMREGLLGDIDSLLEKPWRLGIDSVDRFNDLNGVLVSGVSAGSAASEAGLKSGDVVTHVNGQPLSASTIPFRWIIANAESSDVNLSVKSAGTTEPRTVAVRLKRE